MRRSLPNWLWMLGVVFAAVGLLRSSVGMQAPQAAMLPEPLRSGRFSLVGFRVQPLPGGVAVQGRDVSWGEKARFLLVPARGSPLNLELVVRRSRSWTGLVPPHLPKAKLLQLAVNQQIQIGEAGGLPAIRTCVVGSGKGQPEPEAQVTERALNDAVIRWRNRLDPAATPLEALWRSVMIQAGLRVSERWECLMVTLVESGNDPASRQGDSRAIRERLIPTWHELYPQLRSWGERWDGVKY